MPESSRARIPPQLVFTADKLADGTWAVVVDLAARAQLPVNVIVVSRVVDTRLYLEVIEGGAFDFIAAPLASSDIAYVARCAADNVLERRKSLTVARQSAQGALLPPFPQSGPQVAEGPKAKVM